MKVLAAFGVTTLVATLVFTASDSAATCSTAATGSAATPIPAVGLTSEPTAIGATMVAGIGDAPVPDARREVGATQVRTHGWDEYPYLRYSLTFAPGVTTAALTWQGKSINSNDLALHAWVPSQNRWSDALTTAAPTEPGGPITLTARTSVADGRLEVLIIDSPRADNTFALTNAEADRSFADPATYDFAFQHISDTQYVSRDDPAVYRAQTQWTADNASYRKIAYSMHTGDLIQSWIRPGTPEDRARREFEEASTAMRILEDAGVPHGVLPGNHDNIWNAAARLIPAEHVGNHALYNEFFGPQRYRDQPYWGGSVGPDDNSAHYDLIEAGGAKFLMLLLGYNPPEHVLAWAEDVLERYPDRNVVIGTHYYMTLDGTRPMMGFNDIHASAGAQIWNRLVVPHESVFLVLAGHIDGQHALVDRDVDDTGRTVVQLLADYQYFEVDGRRSTGFQRLLQLDLDGSTLAVTTHSPALNSFSPEEYDPGRRYDASDGEFAVDITLRADVPRQVIAGG